MPFNLGLRFILTKTAHRSTDLHDGCLKVHEGWSVPHVWRAGPNDVTDLVEAVLLHLGVVKEEEQRPPYRRRRRLRARYEQLRDCLAQVFICTQPKIRATITQPTNLSFS